MGALRRERTNPERKSRRRRKTLDIIFLAILLFGCVSVATMTLYGHRSVHYEDHGSTANYAMLAAFENNYIPDLSKMIGGFPVSPTLTSITEAPEIYSYDVRDNDQDGDNPYNQGKDNNIENDDDVGLDDITKKLTPEERYNQFKLDVYNSSKNIPIFYNLFVGNEFDAPRVNQIVSEQFRNVLPIHKPIYVNSIGSPLDFNSRDTVHNVPPLNTTKNPVEILGYYKTAAEHITLKTLWDYCRIPENANRRVVYLHSKGSYTATIDNGKLRRFLTSGALSNECATMPKDTCNVCSSRFSPVPHPHTSGNMWMAHCSYVKKLIDPEQFEEAMEGLQYGGGYDFLACDGRGRYSAEHWIHSHPTVKPCDLYNSANFTWNYDGVPTVNQFKANMELKVAPRFELEAFLKTKIRICTGRGASKNFRIKEYIGLYNEYPDSDWWGHKFLKDQEDWWPHRDYGWAQLPQTVRNKLIEFGFDDHLWTIRHHPYRLWGKTWHELTSQDRQTLTDVFVYTEETWNNEIKSEETDANHILDSVRRFEPNLSFDRCNTDKEGRDSTTGNKVKPWYPRKEENENRPLKSFIYEASTKPPNKKRLLIIAAVPRDETHLLTLWSELECFAESVDHVLISAPMWGQVYIEHIILLAKKYIPHFINGKVTMEGKYFVNNRYDVGLWCDAYESLDSYGTYDEYGLINDSVYALRKFSAVFDNLEHKNVSLSSLSHSYSAKWNIDFGPQYYWVESVYRAFDRNGIQIFNDHSCVPEDNPKFCPEEENNKACIINNFEHDLANEYACDKVAGVYPADSVGALVPEDMRVATWIKNIGYWRMLVDHMGFPVAKANEREQVAIQSTLEEKILSWQNNPLLKTCTSHIMDRLDELFNKDLPTFRSAKPFFKRRWVNLPPNLQELAEKTLGYNEKIWNRANDSPILAGKKWKDLTVTQQQALQKLECSMLQYNQDGCHVPMRARLKMMRQGIFK